MKKQIEEILDYLADEDRHFWESCTCSDEVLLGGLIHLCKCENNKEHIWRTREEVKDWLESPYCPLIDKEEFDDEINSPISLEQESRNRREWAERYEMEDKENGN